MYLPFKPIKNQPFRLYFDFTNVDDASRPDTESATLKRTHISQDGAAFVLSTNNRVQIAPNGSFGTHESQANYYIDLTASEMNADVIVVQPYANVSGATAYPIVIHTTVTTTAEEVWGHSERELTGIDAVKLDDIIPNASDLPNGNLTVLQALSLIIKRFKRSKNSPKI